ncbi:glycosyl hydrolase [Actinomadura sp. HBU206391]|uniref:glycosyl hydrolase n=1 Tax=Actinomadura sp. HBU206391 TaxID=2731692 RepID=UPI00164F675C|nr:glycosyl hydrolase [Actinomadura sp. HBU206391]MBC6459071.1 hypothetical protein [Actinomadura sp. HBU206391]
MRAFIARAGRGAAVTALTIAVLIPGLAAGDAFRAPDARGRADRTGASGDQDGVILGAVGNSRAETIERERETGRRVQGIRAFKRWNEPLIGADQRWAKRTHHTVFLSVKSRLLDGSLLRWRDIANAAPGSPLDADLHRQARELKSFRATVYLIFNHEPDAKTSRPMGEPADFVAAWRRLVSTHREAGVTNVRYVWTMTDQAFQQGYADKYYPGDRYVDGIAVDAYNWYDCRGGRGRWTSLADLIEPHRRFGLRHPGKDLMVLEWGSVEDRSRPGRKAQWIRDAAALFDRPKYRAYRALAHWDDRYTGPPSGQPCQFDYRTSPAALAAWRDMAAGSAFRARPAR